MQTNVESWTCQRMRGGHGKQSRAVLLSRRKPSCFSSVSPDMLMWKWERTRDICSSSVMKIIGDRPPLSPFHGRWFETKQTRETAAVNKAVCGFILPFLPSAASSNGSFKNIPALTRDNTNDKKTNSLISWRMLFWFGFITNISILCVIYSTILAKLSTVCFFSPLEWLKWSFWKAL